MPAIEFVVLILVCLLLPAYGMGQSRPALIVVDMQNDFAHPKGSLYVPTTEKAIPVIADLLRQAREKKIPIFFTQDWHQPDDISFIPQGGRWPVHGVRGTWGAQVVEALQPLENEYLVQKQTYDAFCGTALDWWLAQKKVDTLIITGTVSNICVCETASGAAKRGYKILLPTDAIAPLNEAGQQIAIRQISLLWGGLITTADQVFSPQPKVVSPGTQIAPGEPFNPSLSEVRLPARSTALVVVDMQNDFAHSTGTLFVPNAAQVTPAIAALLSQARARGVPIFYTQDWHRADDLGFKSMGGMWPAHCLAFSWGAQIIEALRPQPGDYAIQKQTYDAFFDTPMDWWLRQKKIDTLVFTGTASNICVYETASSAAKAGYSLVVPMDGIAALNDADQHLALQQLSGLWGATITRTDKIVFDHSNPQNEK